MLPSRGCSLRWRASNDELGSLPKQRGARYIYFSPFASHHVSSTKLNSCRLSGASLSFCLILRKREYFCLPANGKSNPPPPSPPLPACPANTNFRSDGKEKARRHIYLTIRTHMMPLLCAIAGERKKKKILLKLKYIF